MTPQEPETVTLVDLEGTPFREYRERLVRDYAADKVRAGVWSEDGAEARSARS